MSAGAPFGPPVPDEEDLYRAITHPSWWKAPEGRPSSAAFAYPKFSVDIASLTTAERTLDRVRHIARNPGLVEFHCGAAREFGFDSRAEPDEKYPENEAHAHVYCSLGKSQRKRRAQALAQSCAVVAEPAFD
ncbi:MAG: hypothetical protein WD069_16715 [Planctomycetales bacterium]